VGAELFHMDGDTDTDKAKNCCLQLFGKHR